MFGEITHLTACHRQGFTLGRVHLKEVKVIRCVQGMDTVFSPNVPFRA